MYYCMEQFSMSKTFRLQRIKHTNAGVASGGQFEAGFTAAFKASVHVDANSVRAHADFSAFIHVGAQSTVGRNVETWRTLTDEASWSVDATTVLALPFSALVNV